MSDHSDNESQSSSPQRTSRAIDNNIDADTLRIMVSTDNHLGYLERDPIRGNDSFAAFEEVLLLSKRHKCDMVLLAGDLFHENKPSRLTLHKTMGILRRYTMGPNPVQFQIVSDQAQNFRSTISNTVNYEDPYSCVDLPIFAIHGNHDDPTRDGGTEMLAALDLLAVNHLVNYFGRHDEVDKVQVSPVLIQKGETKVALYGMGSMRDERLNRMWQGNKVRFLRPKNPAEDNHDEEGQRRRRRNGNNAADDSDDDNSTEGNEWFNIFALHQNRDLGRGSKNCVHESMIPEWMDLVVWGHEHECLIHPSESAVGTFRITQPGSSVATSLTEGESVRKHVGILDVRGSQFRMTALPLIQVRSFAVGQIVLSESHLDPEDPRIEDAIRELLVKEVEKLADQARKDSKLLEQDAQELAGGDDTDGGSLREKLHYRVEKPEQVLVRLKVEHSGFSTLHNQRFGSQFVNSIANPSDILLFYRRRSSTTGTTSKKKGAKSKADKSALLEPIAPIELEEIHIEDVIKDTLGTSDKKLQILDEHRLSLAVEDFVSKEQKGTIGETVGKIVTGQQRKLVRRGFNLGDGNEESGGSEKVSTANAVREACQADVQKAREEDAMSVEEEVDDEDFSANVSNEKASSRSRASPAKKRSRAASISEESKESSEEEEYAPSTKEKIPNKRTVPVRKRNTTTINETFEESPARMSTRKKYPRQSAASGKKRYAEDSSEEEDEYGSMNEDSDVEIVEKPSVARQDNGRTRPLSKRKKTTASYAEDNDTEAGPKWGLASTSSSRNRRY